MAKKFIKERTVNELNKRLGIRLFRLKEIGQHTKLTYGNKYVLNATILNNEILIYKDKEKNHSNLYLTIDVSNIGKDNSSFWLNNIKELIESLQYKRELYKIYDKKSDALLVRYGFIGNNLLVETTSFVTDADNIVEGLDDLWLTDIRSKAENVVKMLNEKSNSKDRFSII